MRLLFNHSISGLADVIDLLRLGHPDIHVTATHEREDTPIRLAADVMLPEPAHCRAMSDADYVDWLMGVAVVLGAELVVPYRRREALAGMTGRFQAAGIRLGVAGDAAMMTFLEDKPAFLGKADSLGLAITPFRLFEGEGAYTALRAEGDLFPGHEGALCVKPASGIYGAGFRIIRDGWDSTRTRLSSISARELPDPVFRSLLASLPVQEPMMLMPFLEGPERSVDFACLDGRLLGTVTRTKVSSTEQHVGHDPEGERIAETIVREFGLSGVLNLQTMEDRDGVQRLLEVNSRASGGIGMTALSGVNLPALWLSAIKGDLPASPARAEGAVKVGRRDLFWRV